jgi:hypothetical protein
MTDEQALMVSAQLAAFFDRRPWSAEKIRLFARSIADMDFGIAAAAADRWMADETQPPLPRDLREKARFVPPSRLALPAPPDQDGWPKRYYPPGDDYVRCTTAERRRMQATSLRTGTETAAILAGRRREREQRRAARDGDPVHIGGAVAGALESLLRMFLRHPQRCDWCRRGLTEENLGAYLEFCRDLAEVRPIGTPMPAARVFCEDCAPGAISELIDGFPWRPTGADLGSDGGF